MPRVIHGGTNTRLHRIWMGMKNRCYLHTSPEYKWYGAKGIKICREWFVNFVAFRDWALSNGYEEHLTIERRERTGNYEPSNCCWITNQKQARNRLDNRRVIAFGETKIVKEWSEDSRCRVSYPAILKRLNAGWKPEDAISFPPRVKPTYIS